MQNNTIEILNVRQLTEQEHINMFGIDYVDRTGCKKTWHIASRGNTPKCLTPDQTETDAVIIVPYHIKARKLVVIREFRVPLGTFQYGFPAGLVESGESLEDACRRELVEETGLRIVRFRKTSPPVFSSSGLTDETVSLVYVECEGEPSDSGNESSELIETHLVSSSEAKALLIRPGLKFDVKTWIVLTAFADNGATP